MNRRERERILEIAGWVEGQEAAVALRELAIPPLPIALPDPGCLAADVVRAALRGQDLTGMKAEDVVMLAKRLDPDKLLRGWRTDELLRAWLTWG